MNDAIDLAPTPPTHTVTVMLHATTSLPCQPLSLDHPSDRLEWLRRTMPTTAPLASQLLTTPLRSGGLRRTGQRRFKDRLNSITMPLLRPCRDWHAYLQILQRCPRVGLNSGQPIASTQRQTMCLAIHPRNLHTPTAVLTDRMANGPSRRPRRTGAHPLAR